MAAIPQAQTRYLRAVNATVVVIPKVIRTFFLTKHPKTTLTKALSSKEVEIKNYPGVNKGNINLLLPGKGKQVDPEEFDITLLTTLLRNFSKIPPPSTGWTNPPNTTDTCEGADLVRIRLIRNHLMHKNDGELEQQDFKDMWSDIKKVVNRLGKGMFDTEIAVLQISSIDATQKEVLNQFKREFCKLEEIETEIDKIKVSYIEIESRVASLEKEDNKIKEIISQLPRGLKQSVETIPENIHIDMEKELLTWVKENETFHVTKFAEKLLNTVLLHNIVTVVGKSGSGKTATTRYVALQLRSRGYKIIPVNYPDDIQKYHNTKENQIFVVDDVVGNETLNENQSYNWERKSFIEWAKRNNVIPTERIGEIKWGNIKEDVTKSNKVDINTCKILVTCRSIISNSRRFKKIGLLCTNILNIDIECNKIDFDDRKGILQKYTELDLHKNFIMCHDNFPLLCRIFSTNESFHSAPEEFFRHPFSVYIQELTNLFELYKHHYCALICLLLFGEDVAKNEEKYVDGIRDVYKSFEFKFEYSMGELEESLEQLRDIYVRRISQSHIFLHTALVDMMAYHLCVQKKKFSLLTKFGPLSIIRDRVRPFEVLKTDDQEDKYFIIISGSNVDLLIERIFKEIAVNANWEDIFHLPYFPNDCLENELGKVILKEKPLLFIFSKADIILKENPLSSIPEADSNISAVSWGNLSKLRIVFLTESSLLLWSLGFGWSNLFNVGLENIDNVFRETITSNRDLCYSLSLMSNNTTLVEKIDSMCTVQKSCLLCEKCLKKPEFEHSANCPVSFVSDIYIPCLSGSKDIMNYVLKRDPTININKTRLLPHYEFIEMSEHVTPLQLTCITGFYDVANLLLAENADVEAGLSNTDPPIYMASRRGFSDIVSLLISKGASINEYKTAKSTPLIEAIKDGSKEVVHELLLHGVAVNNADKYGNIPLIVACNKNHEKIVKMLIDSKAEVNISNKDGRTPLWFACSMGYKDIVLLLLDNGALHTADLSRVTPLHEAVENKYEDIVQELLSRKDFATSCRYSYLHTAVLRKNCKILEMLLTKNADVDKMNSLGNTPLHLSCESNDDSKLVKILLDFGADMDLINYDGETALIISTKYDCNTTITLLLENGADVNIQDEYGRTALWWSCVNGNLYATRLLLRKNSDVNMCCDEGTSPLFWACSNGYINIVKELISFGANNSPSNAYITPFWVACSSGKKEVVEFLLKRGVDPTISNDRDESPLWIACKNGHYRVVSFLLDKRVYSEKDKTEKSPLRMACILQKRDIFQILMNHGFQAGNIQYTLPRTCECITREMNFSSLMDFYLHKHKSQCIAQSNLRLLRDCFSNIDRIDIFGNTALIVASKNGFSDILLLLLSQGADVNFRNPNDGMTALSWAALKGREDILLMLMGFGANPKTSDNNGRSPLWLSCWKGHKLIAFYLICFGADVNQCAHRVTVLSRNNLFVGYSISFYKSFREGRNAIDQIDLESETVQTNKDRKTPRRFVRCKGCKYLASLLLDQSPLQLTSSAEGYLYEYSDTPLIAAVREGHEEVVVLLLSYGADVNETNNDEKSPLWFACFFGHEKIVSILLNHGAELYSDLDGKTPLLIAIENDYVDIVREIIKTNFKICGGLRYLKTAIRRQNIQIVKLLLIVKNLVNYKDSEKNTPLHISCETSASEDLIKLLLSYDADVNVKNGKGDTALIISSKHGLIKIVSLLLEKGSKIDQQDACGRTALWWACVNCDIKMTSVLLGKKANVNLQDNFGTSPLFWACSNGFKSIAILLLSNGANVNSKGICMTPFLAACEYGHLDIISLLLENNADVSLCNNNDESPLWEVCRKGLNGIVSFLLQKGAYTEEDITERSPLRTLCIFFRENLVKILMKFNVGIGDLEYTKARSDEKKRTRSEFSTLVRSELSNKKFGRETIILEDCFSDLNKVDDHGNTPLIVATKNELPNIVSLLLLQGALVNYENPSDGMTALSWATSKGYTNIVLVLLGYGANVNSCDKNGKSPLWYACCFGNAPIAEYLIYFGADVNQKIAEKKPALTLPNENMKSKFEDIETPLLVAIQNGHQEVIKTLLTSKAVVNASNRKGRTPLWFACFLGYNNIVSLLLDHGATQFADSEEETPLYKSVENEDILIVSKLLKKVCTLRENRKSCLHLAIRKRNLTIVELLLKASANVDELDSEKNTPLHMICKSACNAELLKLLLQFHADPNKKNNNGETALIISAKRSCSEMASLLLEKESEINQQDVHGRTALLWACVNRDITITNILLKNYADINIQDKAGTTPLYWACCKGQSDIAKELISHGASVNQDNLSMIPFWAACNSGILDIVEIRFKNGANQTICNDKKESPFWIACSTGNDKLVYFLLQNGVYTDKDVTDHSPLRISCIFCRENVIENLMKFGVGIGDFEYTLVHNTERKAEKEFSDLIDLYLRRFEAGVDDDLIFRNCYNDLDKIDVEGNTPLIVACKKGHIELVSLLLLQGSLVNYKNSNDGMTALLWATLKGDKKLVLILLGYGSDVNLCDKYGQSALTLAYINNHHQIAKLLVYFGANLCHRSITLM